MFTLQPFLANKIFNGYMDLCTYLSPDYYWQDRDQAIDDKYVYYTIEKDDPHSWCGKRLDKEKCTIGRYLRKAYSKLTPAQITHVCEKYKSLLLEGTGTFKILEGDDIKKAYFRTSYVPSHGTLSNSCMRFLKCQRGNYFQIYADNAKMLVMTPKRGKRILGRAILWKYKDYYLMDRVYTTENYIEHQFYTYAKKMGYGILARNRFVDTGYVQKWLLPDDGYKEEKEVDLTIQLDKKYDRVPFIDSVCYMSSDQKTLSTRPYKDTHFMLHNTNGRKIIRLF